jgi:hypothetical protein
MGLMNSPWLYPDTAYPSLEEIDTIFRKMKGWFDVIGVARDEPQRYGKESRLSIISRLMNMLLVLKV